MRKAQEATIIFPHQLFKHHPAVAAGRTIYLVEEWLFFKQYNFIKQKLLLHRASMQFYKNYLEDQYEVEYIPATDPRCAIQLLIPFLITKGVERVHFAMVSDDWLQRRLHKAAAKASITLVEYDSPDFLNKPADVAAYFDGRKRYFMADFYQWQRKQRGILIEGHNKPVGGKWSFDDENRKKLPKGERIPVITFPAATTYIAEAIRYVEKNYGENYGSTASFQQDRQAFYPVTFEEAEKWLQQFVADRLGQFGVYEDAMVAHEHYLYHGVLTPMLNIGLLQPQQIIDTVIQAAGKYAIPLNSLEGFIRQVMGWREYIHLVYLREGRRQRTKNYWGFTRKIPPSFWEGTTGIIPIDTVIKKVLKTGYCHHIERLMVLGNFMLLCEFDPDDVYRWFMEMFVDAYDWVMVPNTYGMTQFSDGGLMMTKPYISSSNYIMKMSDYKKGEWQLVWDGLFWRFMHVHRDVMSSNQRLSLLLKTYDNMAAEKKHALMVAADSFLDALQ